VRVTSKVKALRKIWNRHNNLLTFQAKQRATAGRVAAYLILLRGTGARHAAN
jgi:hypothetical protein